MKKQDHEAGTELRKQDRRSESESRIAIVEVSVNQKEQYRHELKFQIGYADYLAMRSRLKRVMCPDPHAGEEGTYRVYSIYLDNFRDKALREKVQGVPEREKFRIRYYNEDQSYFVLEKKYKRYGLCRKTGAVLEPTECEKLLSGHTQWMRGHPSALVRELYLKMHSQALRPRVVVSYVREAYLYAAGNVRITFDSQIRTSLFDRLFLNPGGEKSGIPAADAPQDMILEVKYDAFLPELIARLLPTDGLRQQAFSKYAVCRRFG